MASGDGLASGESEGSGDSIGSADGELVDSEFCWVLVLSLSVLMKLVPPALAETPSAAIRIAPATKLMIVRGDLNI
jgi:hypothetical protein